MPIAHRIIHVAEAWNGGISTYINTLIKHQAADERVSEIALLYSPSQVSSGFDAALYDALGVQLVPYESSRNPLKILQCCKDVQAKLAEFKPDIVHLHSTFAGVYGRLLGAEFPTVYCAHGWSFTEEDGTHKRFIYGCVERFLARRSDAIVNISEQEYQSALTHGIDAPLHCAVLNGVDDAPTTLPAIDYAPPPAKLHIGYIGRLDPKKGFDLLHKYMRDHKPEGIHLTVIGDASRSEADYSDDDTAGISYLGWVDVKMLDAYIRNFDAIIVPSRHEGFGLVVIEAMRNGVPAIVARDTAMPEMVEHGRNGFVFDIAHFKEELDGVLLGLDKTRLQIMGKAARKTYEMRFTSARMASEIMDVYESVLYNRSKDA